jgi:hypothetical protein
MPAAMGFPYRRVRPSPLPSRRRRAGVCVGRWMARGGVHVLQVQQQQQQQSQHRRTVFHLDVNAVDVACSSNRDSYRPVGGVRLTRWAVIWPVAVEVLGIPASKHAIISAANPRVATAYRRQIECQPESPNAADCFRACGECGKQRGRGIAQLRWLSRCATRRCSG